MATYSQVELNRCAFLRDGAIESQCIAPEALQNGQIVVVDRTVQDVTYTDANGKEVEVKDALGKVTAAIGDETNAVYGINYTAERIYNQFTPGRKNFCVEAGEYPRVGILSKGDIFTTDAEIPAKLIGKLLVVADANADCADGTAAKKYMVL
jgi:hypothetical protein